MPSGLRPHSRLDEAVAGYERRTRLFGHGWDTPGVIGAGNIERIGATRAAASRAIQDEIRSRIGSVVAPLRPKHTFERAVGIWLTKLEAQVRDGARAVTTADTCRQRFRW
ncbi:MAG: hypothetical protein L0I76_19855 [Pseudonocardia sp.]|nr:hypothetical protein [Pseudonocardia sp.]